MRGPIDMRKSWRWAGAVAIAAVLAGCASAPAAERGSPGSSASPAQGATVAPADSPVVELETKPFRRHRIFPLPIVFYTPETRWAGGAGALWTYRGRPEAKPISGSATFVYTQNDQVEMNLAAEGYSADGVYHGAAKLAGQRFPDVIYGLGNDSPESYSEEYTERELVAGVELKRRVAPGLYLGGSYGWSSLDLVDLAGGGPLSAGIPGAEGGVVSQLGTRLLLDTRDHTFIPTRGVLLSATVRGAGGVIGGDHEFIAAGVDARQYFTVRPGHVVALQGIVTAATEGIPFQEMGTIGGQNLLRGYFGGRFRDRARLALQAEYRLPVWRRIGVVAFAGAGQVAPTPAELGLGRFHAAGGAGLRLMLDPGEGINLRVDFGYGEGGASGVYITFAEAF